jgi:hypothetical protein|tara:strand:- start:417 stop:575 length:159 start_codon:yes stop_codon:yes gene_type:complete
MKKNTYLIISFILVGIALLGGRYLGFSLIERIVAALIVGGLFEIIYRKKLKK